MNKILLLFLSVLPCFGQNYYLTNSQLGLLVVDNFTVTNVLASPKDGTREIELPFTLTITTLTNVVSGDNSSGCNMCYDNNGRHNGSIPAVIGLEPCKPFKPATERWTATNVVRRFTLESFNLSVGDEEFSFKRVVDKPISQVTNHMTLEKVWK